jgi:hypothetical protein
MMIVATTLAAGGAASAQAPGDGQQPAAQPAATRPAPDPRRDDIRVMETVLTKALQNGAEDLARKLKVSEPNSAFVTGTGRARGFVLDGFGIFFDVDVPGMKQSVVWSAQMIELAQQRENVRRFLERSRPDDPLRRVAEAQLRQIDRLMASPQGGIAVPSALANTQLAVADKGVAAAQSVSDSTTTTPPAAAGLPASTPPAAPPAAAPPPATEFRDPNELYTDSVKNALIDAMLKYGPVLKIGDAEWLVVAASDSDGPQVPGQLDDTSRIIIRVKGSDLSAFQAGKLTREEVLKRVEVREF